MIYPQKLNSKKSNLIIKLGLLVSTIVAIILVIINKLTTPEIGWAATANGGIIYVWIVLFYSIKKRINIAGHVLLQTIIISILIVFIDYKLGFRTWSISIGIPIIVMISNITMFVLTIVSHRRFIKYAIYQLLILLFSLLPIIVITENIVHNKVLSIISVGISLLNLVLTLMLCAKDLKEAMIRKFHM